MTKVTWSFSFFFFCFFPQPKKRLKQRLRFEPVCTVKVFRCNPQICAFNIKETAQLSREPRGAISSLAKQLHIARASDLDHSNLYRPSILLKLTNFNQDGGPGSSNNTSGQQHNHEGKINVYIKLTEHCLCIMPPPRPYHSSSSTSPPLRLFSLQTCN